MGKKLFVALLFLIIIGANILWAQALFLKFSITTVAHGGQYVEALVSQPQYINPLLSPRSRLTDKTLSRLIFSSLFSYDNDAFLKPDLADRFERSDDGKVYTVYLRNDVQWHDGENFNADDVLLTVDILRDKSYAAAGVPLGLQRVWKDISVEKKDDYTVVFALQKPRADFLQGLTFGILPEHKWRDIGAEQFQLAELNRKPLGTGPYEFVDSVVNEVGTVTEYTLRANKNYHRGVPYITKMIFKFFPDRNTAIDAYKAGIVSGIVVDKPEHVTSLEDVEDSSEFSTLSLPSYFAVFLNQEKSVPLAFDEVREALTLSIDREKMIEEVFKKSIALPVSSPFVPGMQGYSEDAQQPEYNLEEAIKKLEARGWTLGDDGIRTKESDRLAFTLHVNPKSKTSVAIAEFLAEDWRDVGAEVAVNSSDENMAENVIRPRAYDAVIEAHPMRWDQPQLFALWHSTSKDDPGQNLSQVKDDELDAALSQLLTEVDEEKRLTHYSQVQKRILVEDPAVFLFAPGFVFAHSNELKGIDIQRANTPQDRFANVHEWSIKEKSTLEFLKK